MKKIILLILAITAMGVHAYGQEFGRAKMVKCPHCGTEKAIYNLTSWDKRNGHMWWDLCTDYPMMPDVSAVQLCHVCNKYFVLRTAEVREVTDGPYVKGTHGNLTMRQARKAWEQLHDSVQGQDLVDMALMCLHRYNDFQCEWPFDYKRKNKKETRSSKDHKMAKEVVDVLIQNYQAESPLIYAEWLCNVGEFERAKAILYATKRPNDKECWMDGLDFAKLYDILVQCCETHDSRVRLIF